MLWMKLALKICQRENSRFFMCVADLSRGICLEGYKQFTGIKGCLMGHVVDETTTCQGEN